MRTVILFLRRLLSGLKSTGIVSLVAACAAGCESGHMSYHTVSFNEALEDSDTKVILLNAIRASKRYPMSFSAIGTVLGSGLTRGNLDTNFPFSVVDGVPELPSFTLTPKIQTESGFSSLSTTNLETNKFLQAMNNPAPQKLIRDYIDKGWPEELIVLVFLREVQLTDESLAAIQEYHKVVCYEKVHPSFVFLANYQALCRGIEEIYARFELLQCPYLPFTYDRIQSISLSPSVYRKALGETKDGKTPGETKDGKTLAERNDQKPVKLFRFINNPRNECEFLAFLDIVRKYRLLRARFETESSPGGYQEKTKVAYYREFEGKPLGTIRDVKEEFEQKAGSEVVVFVIDNPLTGELRSFNFGKKKNTVGLIYVRSPHDMIAYVGDLISAQLRENEPHVVQLLVEPEQRKADLFRIESGLGGALASAVSVQHEGITYSIPRPGVGEVSEHRSLQVLALIRQFVAQGIEREDLPKSPQVVVGGG